MTNSHCDPIRPLSLNIKQKYMKLLFSDLPVMIKEDGALNTLIRYYQTIYWVSGGDHYTKMKPTRDMILTDLVFDKLSSAMMVDMVREQNYIGLSDLCSGLSSRDKESLYFDIREGLKNSKTERTDENTS